MRISGPGTRYRGAAGMTLVGTLVGAVLLSVAVLAVLRTTVSGLALERSNRETAIALREANDALETLRATGFRDVFARYDAEPGDDPAGRGTAPGATFAVSGLRARPGQATALGRYIFPVSDAAPGVIDETIASPFHGVPVDLDMDGLTTSRDVTTTCVILPVAVRVEWQGATGPRSLVISTVLTE